MDFKRGIIMKLGVHLSTFMKQWQEPPGPWIRRAAQLGYDGVEIPLPDPFEVKKEEVQKALNASGILCTCGTGLNVSADISSTDPDVRKNGITHIKRCLELCSEFGSDTLSGVLNAAWGMTADWVCMKDRIKYSKELLYKLGDYAEKMGVVMALEILNRYEGSMFNTVLEGKEFVNDIGHQNVKLHFDTYHAHIEEADMEQALRDGAGHIRHVHMGDNQRSRPGSGQIDFLQVCRVLDETGYDRWLTLECFVAPGGEVASGTYTWRNTDTDGIQTAKKGLSFMMEILKEIR